MAYTVIIKHTSHRALIDADEHSIEQAITGPGVNPSPEVARFWKTGGSKRELVAVIPFAEVVLIERV